MEKRGGSSARAVSAEAESLPKVSSGVAGLDEILEGGFPEGRTTLINGGPGTGKTMLALEFLYRSALASQAGILLLFEERAEAVRRNVLSLGWDLAAMEKAGKLFILEAKLDPNAILTGDFNIAPLLAIVKGQAQAMGATRIVIDAIDVLLRFYDDLRREQHELYALHEWLLDSGFTTVMTAKRPEGPTGAMQYQFLEYMADCVVLLDLRVDGQVTTRRLRVVKYRGSGFASNEYPYIVDREGNVIMPISTVSLEHKALGEYISSGNKELDVVLGRGYPRGASVLITGASGTGKTTLACTFVGQVCARGERVLYISFEESAEALVKAMLSPGVDLRPAVKAGTLEFLTVLPEAMGPELHLIRALRRIETFQPAHIVVDAISATQRMSSNTAAFDYLMRLVDACKQRGITTILTNQLASNEMQGDLSGIGFSSLLDVIVMLRFIDFRGEITRSLLVLKSRGTRHSNRYHQYVITDEGIQIVVLSKEARAGLLQNRIPIVRPGAAAGAGRGGSEP